MAPLRQPRYDSPVRVFLSYHHKDADAAEVVRKSLERAGFDVWDPRTRLLPGEDWNKAVGEALQSARAMIVLLSPEAVESPWMKREIAYALGERRFEGRLVPVVVRPVSKVPWILAKLRVLRLAPNVKRGTRRIVEALKHRPSAA